jgi:hypothetical protein
MKTSGMIYNRRRLGMSRVSEIYSRYTGRSCEKSFVYIDHLKRLSLFDNDTTVHNISIFAVAMTDE